MAELRLHDDFPDRDYAEWEQLAVKGLRGAGFDSLVSRTEDGLTRGPLFDADARPKPAALHHAPAPLLEGRGWHVCAVAADDDTGFANAQLLEDLLGGASAVRVETHAISRRADLKRLLEGVYLDLVPVVFAPGNASARFAIGTSELYDTPVSLGLNPLGERPSCPDTWRAFTIDAAAVHEAGGADVLELAVMTATLAESVRLHGEDVLGDCCAELAVDTDAHLSAVKLRAARRLASGVAQGFGVDATDLPLHAVSSRRMMRSADAWTNLLRTQSAGMGAVWGGADYVTLRPLTDPLGKPTAFASRVARNQQMLMMEESHLGVVGDPAHGSFFHERLTEDLAQAAWARFQSIEAGGGINAFIAKGDLEEAVQRDVEEREERNAPILGVTLHPAADVPAPEVRT